MRTAIPTAALAAALAAVLAGAGPAAAHDGVVHASPEEAAAHAAGDAPPLDEGPPPPFPVDIVPRFDLIDQTGARRTEADFAGRRWLLFFGYARCDAICSVALPRMAEALDLLGAAGADVAAVMITVDPDGDTPAALAEAMPRWHPRLTGLTGTPDALASARAAVQVEAAKVAELADGTPVFAHAAHVWLVGPDGRVETILPPILGPERMAEIIRRHL